MSKNYLRCVSNKRKGLWLLAKTRDTYAKYMKEDYEQEEKYLASLSDEEKEWLNTFLQGYYHQNKKAMDILNFPLALRRERYNQHRGVKNDVYNKSNRWDITDLDKGEEQDE